MSVDLNILMDAKTLLEHGKLHASRGKMSRIDRRLSVAHAHHAVELVLRAKAEDLKENPYDIPTAIKILKRHGVSIPYERQVEELNKARVLIQHYGTIPDEKDAYRLVNAAENFMRDFCSSAFSVDYGDISLLQLIENNDIKKTLDYAQKAFEGEKWEEAAIKAHQAIQMAIWIISGKMRRTRPFVWGGTITKDGELSRAIDSIEFTMGNIVDDLDSIYHIALSAPFAADIMRLTGITHMMFQRSGKEILPVKIPSFKLLADETVEEPKPIQREDAEFALELALEYVLWAQQMYEL